MVIYQHKYCSKCFECHASTKQNIPAPATSSCISPSPPFLFLNKSHCTNMGPSRQQTEIRFFILSLCSACLSMKSINLSLQLNGTSRTHAILESTAPSMKIFISSNTLDLKTSMYNTLLLHWFLTRWVWNVLFSMCSDNIS